MPSAAVGGGRKPPTNCRRVITRANGTKEEIGREKFQTLHTGDILTCYAQGGCGVGVSLDREPEKVREDVINGIVSLEKATIVEAPSVMICENTTFPPETAVAVVSMRTTDVLASTAENAAPVSAGLSLTLIVDGLFAVVESIEAAKKRNFILTLFILL